MLAGSTRRSVVAAVAHSSVLAYAEPELTRARGDQVNEPSLESRLDELDVSLLADIESQTSDEDKRSLLALHAATRRAYSEFAWLEVGSHLGGSLQALVRDPACVRIDSIDPRPEVFADERIPDQRYPGNSSQRMLGLLSALPGADVGKVKTHETSTSKLDPGDFPPPQLCFIDGEHTDAACAEDIRFCSAALRGKGVIAFHDIGVIYGAVTDFINQLSGTGATYDLAYLPDSVFAIELGGGGLLEDSAVVGRRLRAGDSVLWLLWSNHRYRALLQGRRARVLRKLRLLPRDW
jgi:hypothetical protein